MTTGARIRLAVLGAALSAPATTTATPCGDDGIVHDPILATPSCLPSGFGLDGEHKEFHANGEVRYVVNFTGGKRNGATTWWYANGREATQGSYLDDRRHGLWTFWTPAGQKEVQGSYDHGKPIGVWQRWYEGDLLPERRFVAGVDPEQCPAGTTPKLVSHAELSTRAAPESAASDRPWGYASFCVTPDGQRQGPFVDWYWDGRQRIEGAYHAGRRHGQWRNWHEPDVWELQLWVMGKRDSEWEHWSHGVKTGAYRYRQGKRHGPQQEWHGNGELALWVEFSGGEPHGVVKQWHANGQPELIGRLARGVREGDWAAWLANGQLRRRGSYGAGERVGVWTYWYENGNLYLSGPYQNGRKHGIWTFWHENGAIGQRGECRKGRGVGLWREWDASGELGRQAPFAELAADLWEEEQPCGELPFIEIDADEPAWAF